MRTALAGSVGLISMLALFGPPASAAQNPAESPAKLAARHFEVRRASSAIHVDGVLDEAAWAEALAFDLPYEWQPGDNVAPPVRTDFLVTYDERALYVAWRCHDPRPQEIRAHLMDRDAIDTFVQDDHVLLLLDPFNDERRGFQFRVNPLGVQADAVNSENEGVEDWSYDLIWESAGRIGAEGYVIEAAIPFSQLRFPSGAEPQTWGFDVGRSYPRNVRYRISSWPRDRDRNCVLCQVDKVSGFVGLKPGRNLEVTPTVTGHRTDLLADYPAGRLEAGDEESDLGLSARWGITSNLSLNAALNPDFSQVEADVAQLEVNERFALFYPEKRPFFLEGIDFFATPLQAVYSRTVVDPDWGVKLTGKLGANALGVFVADDDFTTLIFPGSQESAATSLGAANTTGVARYRRDIGNGSNVGVLATYREGDGYRSQLLGADAFWRFNDVDAAFAQVLTSQTEYPRALAERFDQPRGAFDGAAWVAAYQHAGRDWYWRLSYEDLEPGFRADAGFIPQVDLSRTRGVVQRNFWSQPGDRWTRADVGFALRRDEDQSGLLLKETFDLYGELSGPLQSQLSLELKRSRERAGGQLFSDLNEVEVFAEFQPRGWIKASLYGEGGDTVFFATAEQATGLTLSPSVELKLGRRVNVQASHTYQRFRAQGEQLALANLSQLRLVYNFNVRCFARAIVQYLDLEQNAARFPFPVDPRAETLFTQFLFSYKLNPQTVLFLGYSDNQLGLDPVQLTRTDRTFFAKLGYALIF